MKEAHETNLDSARPLAAKRLKLTTEQFQLEKAKGEYEFQLEKPGAITSLIGRAENLNSIYKSALRNPEGRLEGS